MQIKEKCDKIAATEKRLRCPICGKKLNKLLPSTEAKDLVVYCSRCHRESVVNIP